MLLYVIKQRSVYMSKICKRRIVVDEKNMFKARLEKIDDFQESYFRDVYKQAIDCVNKILKSNTVMTNREMHNTNKRSLDIEYHNNIIAFLGDRGSGKTSSMISFRNALHDVGQEASLELDGHSLDKAENNRKFLCMDVIDPTMFSDNESIIEIIVGKMFEVFKTKQESDNHQEKRNLVKLFQKVHSDIALIHTDKQTILKDKSISLESLVNLGSAVTLKDNLYKLIKEYLSYMGKDVLVLSIDDLDMNIVAGEQMLEEIRKYLILPQVVILMAAKYEQIEEVMHQKHYQHFEKLTKQYEAIDKYQGSTLASKMNTEIHNKTYRYLEKFFPIAHRIHMPSTMDLEAELVVTLNGTVRYESIYVGIASMLVDRFDYYVVTKQHFQYIMPTNLRGLINFIYFIYQVDKKDRNKISVLSRYFNESVIKSVHYRYQEQLYDIFNGDIVTFSKAMLQFINKVIREKITAMGYDAELLGYKSLKGIHFIDIYTRQFSEQLITLDPRSCTIGDVVTHIKMLESLAVTNRDYKVIEILKGMYTIRLLEQYNHANYPIYQLTGMNFIGHYLRIEYGVKASEKLICNIAISRKKVKGMVEAAIRRVDWLLFSAIIERRNVKAKFWSRDYVSGYIAGVLQRYRNYRLKVSHIIGKNIYADYSYNSSMASNNIDGKILNTHDTHVQPVSEKILGFINLDYYMHILEGLQLSLNNKLTTNQTWQKLEVRKEQSNAYDRILSFVKEFNTCVDRLHKQLPIDMQNRIQVYQLELTEDYKNIDEIICYMMLMTSKQKKDIINTINALKKYCSSTKSKYAGYKNKGQVAITIDDKIEDILMVCQSTEILESVQVEINKYYEELAHEQIGFTTNPQAMSTFEYLKSMSNQLLEIVEGA